MEKKELIELIKADIKDVEENDCDDLQDRIISWLKYADS